MTTKRLTKAEKAARTAAAAAPAVDMATVEVTQFEPEPIVESHEENVEIIGGVVITMEPTEVEVPPTLDQAMTALVTVKTHKVVKTVKTGVGAQILQHIADGVLSNKEIVAQVLADNPLRKTTYACVAWYKSQVAVGKIDLPAAKIEVMGEETEE